MADVTTESQRALVEGLKDALGGTGWNQRVVDDGQGGSHRMLEAQLTPGFGHTTLVAHDLWTRTWAGYPHRHVLLCGCKGQVDAAARLLAAVISWLVGMDKRPVPGLVVRQITRATGDEALAARLPHARFDAPFPWSGDELPVVQVDDVLVVPLLVYPVSDAEWQVQQAKGPDALDALFERKRTRVLDLGRGSAV